MKWELLQNLENLTQMTRCNLRFMSYILTFTLNTQQNHERISTY